MSTTSHPKALLTYQVLLLLVCQAYCDDNSTASDPPCPQDGEIPPWQYPSEAIGAEAQERLGFSFW